MKMPLSFIAVLILSACASSDYYEHSAPLPAASEVEGGAIRNNDEARQICPSVCGARGWAGVWRKTGDDHRAVCGCSAPQVAPAEIGQAAAPTGQPTSCSSLGNEACAGCAVSCPAGQQASCTEGVVQQTRAGPAVCEVPARCMCH